AGKSTLFNRLSGAAVQAEDMLFATLDPTMRAIALPTGRHAILADTVGFISDLPTQLVAAFRATLEEVRAADVILHIRDIAHPDTEAQRRDVLTVLAELGIDEGDNRLVEVLNKADLALIGDGIPGIGEQADGRVVVSAVTGAGLDDLMRLLDRMATGERLTLDLAIPLGDGATLAWLHEHGEVLESREDEALRHLRVVLSPADAARLHRRQAPPDDAPAPRAG
ncbi:MAG TPA: GTPase, partial [Alphaproteobacteria bacterium]|nr:GTPase [Alphaproteobacteria bacterium]